MLELLKLIVFSFVRCWHFKKSRIITCRADQPRTAVSAITGTYFVCLNCGKEFAYDLKNARVIDPEPGRLKLISAKLVELCGGKAQNTASDEVY